MRIATFILVLAVLLAAGAASGDWLPGSPWPTPKHDQYGSGCAPPGVPQLQRMKVLWTYQAVNPVNAADPAGPQNAGVVLGNEAVNPTVYWLDQSGNATVYAVRNGALTWATTPSPGSGGAWGGLALGDQGIYAVIYGDGTLNKLDYSGNPVWSVNPSGWQQSDNVPNIVGDTIFMADFEYVYAVRDNGATVTVIDSAKFENEPPLDTWYNSDKIPIQDDGAGNLLLHFAHDTGAWQNPGVQPYNYHVISWDGANFSAVYDGQIGKIWRQGAIDPVTGNIYHATFQDFDPEAQGEDRRTAWAHDIANNSVWFSVDPDNPPNLREGVPSGVNQFNSPAISPDGETVYMGGHASRVVALNAADGTVKWRIALPTGNEIVAAPIVVGDMVYIGASNGNFYGIKDLIDPATTGGPDPPEPFVLFEIDTGDPTGIEGTAAADADGNIYFATHGGKVYALTSKAPGDVDDNGVVDGLDLTAVLTAWATVPGDALWNWDADMDGNNVIDGLDLTAVISNWTVSSSTAAAESETAAKPGKRLGNVRKGR